MVRLSDDEWTAVDAAARIDGLALAAWLGESAVRQAAAGGGWAWGLSRADVVGVLVRVRLDMALVVRLADLGVDGAAQVGELSRAALARLDTLIDRAIGDRVPSKPADVSDDRGVDAASGCSAEPAAGIDEETVCDSDSSPAS